MPNSIKVTNYGLAKSNTWPSIITLARSKYVMIFAKMSYSNNFTTTAQNSVRILVDLLWHLCCTDCSSRGILLWYHLHHTTISKCKFMVILSNLYAVQEKPEKWAIHLDTYVADSWRVQLVLGQPKLRAQRIIKIAQTCTFAIFIENDS